MHLANCIISRSLVVVCLRVKVELNTSLGPENTRKFIIRFSSHYSNATLSFNS